MTHNRLFNLFCSLLALCVATALLTSCKEYLDIKPYDRTIPESAEDFSAIVHEICNGIDLGETIEGEIAGNFSTTSELEEIADNMEVNLSTSSQLDRYAGDHLNNKQSVYKNLYQSIRNCNIILEEFTSERGTREGQDIIGTAYAIRGVCYYQLLREFCAPPLASDGTLGVPIVTEFDMEDRPVRSSMQETIAQVESDFRTALTYDIQNEMYLFNNDVIHGYLARLYHWCGRWQDARTEAKLVLAAHPLLDATGYTAMMSTQYGLTGNRIFMGNRLVGNSAIDLATIVKYLNDRPLSVRFTSLFAEGTNDVRRANSFFFNRKRKNRKLIFSDMRSAEFALIAMECAYHLGDNATALSELNDFRRLRITTGYVDLTETTLPPVDSNELIKEDALGNPLTPLLQAILNERRKEFYLENGDRWFELKRNGRPEWWVAYNGDKYTTQKYMYTWPIPAEDIQLQPGIIQNPGYEKTY